jgi:hypothetical protein
LILARGQLRGSENFQSAISKIKSSRQERELQKMINLREFCHVMKQSSSELQIISLPDINSEVVCL